MTTRDWWRSPLALAGVGSSLLVIALDVALRHLPGSASAPALFIGRFHPLAVHLPIGVILLVAAAEVASFFPRYRQRVDGGIALTLPVLLAGALVAFLLGHLLARSGGFPARSLVLHRRMELFAVVGVGVSAVAWAYQEARATVQARYVYRGVFGLTLGVLSGGAHFGGTMTRGDNYLSKHAPAFLAPLLGGVEPREKAAATPLKPPTPKGEPLVLADVVLPILKDRCVECHGAEQQKGELRLDSLAAIRRGGESGAVVVEGSPEQSPLLGRMLLPVDDDDRMPPEGKPGPTPAERDVIRFWIERGATDTLRVRDALAPASGREVLERALAATVSSGVPARGRSPASADPHGISAPPLSIESSATDVPASPSTRGTDARETVIAPTVATPPTVSSVEPSSSPGRSAEAVLAEKCGDCHSAKKQKGKLRVDSLDALLSGGKHGPAVVAGRPADSLLIQRVELSFDAEGHMPPKDKPQLTATERALLASFVKGLGTRGGASSALWPGSDRAPADPVTSDTASTAPTTDQVPGAPPPTPASTPGAAPAEIEDTSPPDPDLVARLPSRVDLFATAVSALLEQRCAKCHAGKFPAGNLSVADHAALRRGGNAGPAVVPGDLEKSTLWQRVSLPLSDGDHMPPEEEPQLSPDELTLLRAYVLKGGQDGMTVATTELPAGAVRALAARAPATSPPATTAPRTAGCGACAVGDATKQPIFPRLGAIAVVFFLALRRRSRRRPG